MHLIMDYVMDENLRMGNQREMNDRTYLLSYPFNFTRY